MAQGLTLQDLAEIKADAHKAVTRQFRDAAEDSGWEPTPTPEVDEAGVLVDQQPVKEPTYKELQAQAADLGLDIKGKKAELQARIDEHNAQNGVE
jgi:hypothetical protein